jgi:hypothetical protein
MVHIELHHTSNFNTHQILLCIKLCCASSSIGLHIKFCCVVHRVSLHCKLCCATLQTLLCCVTLHYVWIPLHCIGSFIALQTLLCYDVTLLCYATNSIVVYYIAILLHYVANSIALRYEVYCIVHQVLLHCIVSFASRQASLNLVLITCTHKNND